MELTFDIFRTDASGAVCWVEAVSDLATAKVRIQTIAARSKGTFMVLNQRTHSKIRVEVNSEGALIIRPA